MAESKLAVDLHVIEFCGAVPHVGVDHNDPLDGALLVALHHHGVVAGHPDDRGGLHAGEEHPSGYQGTGWIGQEFFTLPALFCPAVPRHRDPFLFEPQFHNFEQTHFV